jgi:hypothetical protein
LSFFFSSTATPDGALQLAAVVFWYARLGVAAALAVGHIVSAIFPSKGPPCDLETMAAERATRLSAATPSPGMGEQMTLMAASR